MPGENPKNPFTAIVRGGEKQICGDDRGQMRRRRCAFPFAFLPGKHSDWKPVFRRVRFFHSSPGAPVKPFRLSLLQWLPQAGVTGLLALSTPPIPAFAATDTGSSEISENHGWSLAEIGTALIQDRSSILLLAIFCGAISFSFLAVFWMIRERARISEENSRLRKSFSGMRADRDRLAALLEVDDLCIIVWNGDRNGVQVLGNLNHPGILSNNFPADDAPAGGATNEVASGVTGSIPEANSHFLAFGKWLTSASAMEIEKAIQGLRTDGQQFTIELATRSGAVVEAQGRVSGGQAFVRFVILDGTRENLAKLTKDYNQLMGRLGIIEKLFDNLPAPLWIRSRDGVLAYVNPAYAAAVEAEDGDDAVRNNKDLFDAKERAFLSASLEKNGAVVEKLPAVAAGDRKIMETIVIGADEGSAGLAIDRSDVEAVRATLKHAIASHQQTFDHLNSAVAIFDAGQKLQFHNSSFQQMWGLSTSDLEGNPSNGDLLEMLRSQSRLPEMPDWKKWKTHQLECYHATETRAENWHLPDGRTLRVVVNPQNQGGASWVFENVTEELALKSNYNSLMRVQGETLDHLNEAVAVFGSDGKVRLTNPAFLSLWKFETPEAVEGHHIKKVTKQVSDCLKDRAAWEAISLGRYRR